MEVYHLVYVSTATAPPKPEAIRRILDASSRKNKEINVTGLLLYRFGFLVQLLEGDEAVVKNLYDKIAKDPRHHDCAVVLEFHDASRLFPQWNMGVVKVDEDANQLTNAVKLLRRASPKYQDDMAIQAKEILTAFSKKYSLAT